MLLCPYLISEIIGLENKTCFGIKLKIQELVYKIFVFENNAVCWWAKDAKKGQ